MQAGALDKDDFTLTISQLSSMDNDLLLSGMCPLLLSSSGMSQLEVDALIEAAYHNLYYPIAKPSTHLHVVHAIKQG